MSKSSISLLLLSSLVLTACTGGDKEGDPASEGETIKIGVIAPLSGDAAVYGEEIHHILDYALPILNAETSDSGYTFELVYEDGKCVGPDAVTAFQKLTDVDGVKFIIGGMCSSESLGIAPLLEEKNVLAISPLSSNPQLLGISPNFFSLSYSDTVIGDAIADKMGEYTKVAMLTEQHDFSTGLRDRVKMRLEEMYPGVEIVANEEYPRDTVEFRNQLLKIQGTEPEIILLSTAPGITSSGALIKQMGEMSDWEVQKIGPLPLINEVTLTTGAAIEGTIMVDVPTIDDADFAAVLDVIHSAQGGTDNIGSYYAASTYDSLVLLIDLIAEHGEDVDAVRTALEEGTFEGHLGEISFAPTHYPNGIGAAAFVVKDGALEPLE